MHLAYKFVNICSIVCTWLPNILLFATYFAADVHIDYSRHLLRLTCKFVKSLARCSREELQSSMKSQLTQPAAQDSEERVLHPVHGGQSPIRPHNAEVGLRAHGAPSSLANCAVQAIREGHPCTERKNRSTSPAGVLPSVRRPPGAPKGFPGQWSFSSPGAHDGHPHRGPPNQGRSPPANADDGAAHRRRLAVKGVPAIPLLIQGALRQREGGGSND